MSSPVFMLLRLLRDPEISNKVILQFAFRQAKAIGLQKVLAALLGALVLGVSSFIKIPQITKILRQKTAEKRAELASGLSQKSVRLEFLSQLVHVAYNQQHHNSFVNYGESLFLGAQNAALLLVLKYYELRKELKVYSVHFEAEQREECLRKLINPALSLVLVLAFITKLAPRGLVLALQVVGIPIALALKIPQIQRNAQLRSTKHLSGITVGANVVGSVVRVFTTYANFKKRRSRDYVLLAGYLTSLALNSALAAQIYQYLDEGKSEEK